MSDCQSRLSDECKTVAMRMALKGVALHKPEARIAAYISAGFTNEDIAAFDARAVKYEKERRRLFKNG